MSNLEDKAVDYLVSGKVRAVSVTPDEAFFHVYGSMGDPYYTRCRDGMWTCDCPARVETCAHIIACGRLVELETKKPRLGAVNAEIDSILGL